MSPAVLNAGDLRGCSRAGCTAAEQTPGEFSYCSRCKQAVYCSRECQRKDYCSASHSTCALRGLQDAAVAGPLSRGHCKNIVELMGDRASELTLPLLDVVTTAGRHYHQGELPDTILSSKLVPTLLALSKTWAMPPAVGPVRLDPNRVRLIDAMAAALAAVIQPYYIQAAACHHLRQPPATLGDAMTLIESTMIKIHFQQAFVGWLLAAAFTTNPSSQPGRQQQGDRPPAPQDPTGGWETLKQRPGAGAAVLLGTISGTKWCLDAAKGLTVAPVVFNTQPYSDRASVAKLLGLCELLVDLEMWAQAGGIFSLLWGMLGATNEEAAKNLLGIPDHAQLLIKGMRRPALMRRHANDIAQDSRTLEARLAQILLCQQLLLTLEAAYLLWVAATRRMPAAVEGVCCAAVDLLASLLDTEAGKYRNPGGASTRLLLLAVLCHMANTAPGCEALAADDRLPLWISHARDLRADEQLMLAQLLALALDPMTKSCRDGMYWRSQLIPEGLGLSSMQGIDIREVGAGTPNALEAGLLTGAALRARVRAVGRITSEVAAPTVLKALCSFCERTTAAQAKGFLMLALQKLCEHKLAVPYPDCVISAIIASCTPSVARQQVPVVPMLRCCHFNVTMAVIDTAVFTLKQVNKGMLQMPHSQRNSEALFAMLIAWLDLLDDPSAVRALVSNYPDVNPGHVRDTAELIVLELMRDLLLEPAHLPFDQALHSGIANRTAGLLSSRHAPAANIASQCVATILMNGHESLLPEKMQVSSTLGKPENLKGLARLMPWALEQLRDKALVACLGPVAILLFEALQYPEQSTRRGGAAQLLLQHKMLWPSVRRIVDEGLCGEPVVRLVQRVVASLADVVMRAGSPADVQLCRTVLQEKLGERVLQAVRNDYEYGRILDKMWGPGEWQAATATVSGKPAAAKAEGDAARSLAGSRGAGSPVTVVTGGVATGSSGGSAAQQGDRECRPGSSAVGTAARAGGAACDTGQRWQCGCCGKVMEDKSLLCSGCMQVRYCSKECQKAHWKQHRKGCREVQAARTHG